ncbi:MULTISPECIES: AMP-binding protein [Halomonadaceae]|jgi:long-chain acyl-CoA synthetase|uniref:AMP-binding protein n=1 Tax=Halomonadaceae TaxID=28256 RepID=UPI0012F1E5C0|nr:MULTISPECIES: AMP-binding protein [Halomonas]CAD5246231.1 acyl-CoA synthetase (long-chain-fatty-acid--CoA ligase) [Halomonas sp. 59]CAD5246422.1 acyl-CoA synthetase (long-chain-fatty-acid--CoA ligase) [Halomonas sp. 113]CAD5253301.1 acyl-CoA synthetase (long-chain-fatty-acid--CoA ligase) [Halomonas sp. 156]CAD5290318.1 acyl-CoA synthetase (long-chain-fatty-acid--CoA ligase) [Halomonas sp. I3]VXB90762.1 acyl-CoA synthetase (long-chain-fatty-acid--CoA ligase) [Halomonas titanicae]|tara:strand:- start:22 stop:1692 length:1671 start_codon:yes stop_codon:yes gene_type:complete
MSEHANAAVLRGPALEGLDQYDSVTDVFHNAVTRFKDKPAFSCMGKTLSFADLDRLSADFAAWLQHETDLVPGDRIAIQLPNVLQFPVAVFGALRAGLVVVNTNPLYTEREMANQFKDSNAKAIVILANMADKLEKVLDKTDIKHVLVTQLADLHDVPKRWLINAVVKHVKKMVPAYSLPSAVGFRDALKKGASLSHTEVKRSPDDLAALQYTGGTTGMPKGAMLTHRNLIANMLQAREAIGTHLTDGEELVIAPLPVYHIYTFTVNCLFLMETGNHSLLITNPRDLDGFIKELKGLPFSAFIGLNTLFNALCNRDDFKQLDFSKLKLTISGGMALTKAAAQRWEKTTGCPIAEGYGLTETSPIVSFNPTDSIQLGTIGKPVAGTAVKVVDADGNDVALGEPGELCVQGPQVMKGYWQREDETRDAIDEDGWFRTGDIAVLQDDGYIRIVDRKKDMILVSGFNVYPNEVEDVVAAHPDVLESAAVGVPDENAGEAIKLFVVSKNDQLDEKTLRDWCKKELTGYKVPKFIEFRDELPKTNVGKVLRRQLRDEEPSKT